MISIYKQNTGYDLSNSEILHVLLPNALVISFCLEGLLIDYKL